MIHSILEVCPPLVRYRVIVSVSRPHWPRWQDALVRNRQVYHTTAEHLLRNQWGDPVGYVEALCFGDTTITIDAWLEPGMEGKCILLVGVTCEDHFELWNGGNLKRVPT